MVNILIILCENVICIENTTSQLNLYLAFKMKLILFFAAANLADPAEQVCLAACEKDYELVW